MKAKLFNIAVVVGMVAAVTAVGGVTAGVFAIVAWGWLLS